MEIRGLGEVYGLEKGTRIWVEGKNGAKPMRVKQIDEKRLRRIVINLLKGEPVITSQRNDNSQLRRLLRRKNKHLLQQQPQAN